MGAHRGADDLNHRSPFVHQGKVHDVTDAGQCPLGKGILAHRVQGRVDADRKIALLEDLVQDQYRQAGHMAGGRSDTRGGIFSNGFDGTLYAIFTDPFRWRKGPQFPADKSHGVTAQLTRGYAACILHEMKVFPGKAPFQHEVKHGGVDDGITATR